MSLLLYAGVSYLITTLLAGIDGLLLMASVHFVLHWRYRMYHYGLDKKTLALCFNDRSKLHTKCLPEKFSLSPSSKLHVITEVWGWNSHSRYLSSCQKREKSQDNKPAWIFQWYKSIKMQEKRKQKSRAIY